MTQPSAAVDIPRSACTAGSATATIVTSRTITNCARHGKATTIPRVCPTLLPSNTHMLETPTAATMRLDGGHPALELVNTIYAVLGGPVDFDVLTTPDDLVTFARRVGAAGEGAVPSDAALRAARALRDALDPLLRAPLVARDADAARRDAAVRGERAAAVPLPARVATASGEADVAPALAAF